MKKIIALLFLLPLLTLACKKDNEKHPELTGYDWKFVEVFGAKVPDQVKATLFLLPSEPLVSGSSGCNAYSAEFVLNGAALQFDQLIATEKACQGIMDWESDIFDALRETHHHECTDGVLRLFNAGGAVVAVLE